MGKWSKYFLDVDSIETYEELFDNLKIIDCHAHIGVDKDGMTLTAAGLIKKMDESHVDKAAIFPFNDPRKQKNFELANDEIFSAFEKNKDRLIPFFRLNPKKGWKEEFSKRIGQGFKGLKLHPRSQDFDIVSVTAKEIYAKCEKESLPILIHTGFGLGEISEKLLDVAKTFPKLKLILGHSAFVDIDNVIRKLKYKKNIFFDISTIKLFDMYDLMKNIDYSRILFGSDEPYGQLDLSIETLIDVAVASGVKQRYIRDMLAYNFMRCLK